MSLHHRVLAAACCLGCLACGDEASSTATGTTGVSSGAGGAAQGGSGGLGDGGGGAGGGSMVDPIEGPADEWAWRPIEGTKCANGSTAGVSVNLHPGSTDLFLIVSGGGACWNDEMCNGANPLSIHLHEELTEALIAPELPAVDRSDPSNPLSSASWVYVPYCTGDLHWGDRTASYPGGAIEHRGASNMRTFLERLRATRPGTGRVWMFGVSAGGYGVTLHWGTTKEVFGSSVEVHAMADASPLVMPLDGRWDAMKTEWSPVFPPGCTTCADDTGNLLDALATEHPSSRHGLMVYDSDAVIADYMGYSGNLPAAIDALQSAHHDPFANAKYFVTTGADHGVFGDDITAPDGTTPFTFFTAWLFGDAGWHSVDF